jgi:hypothetical protein
VAELEQGFDLLIFGSFSLVSPGRTGYRVLWTISARLSESFTGVMISGCSRMAIGRCSIVRCTTWAMELRRRTTVRRSDDDLGALPVFGREMFDLSSHQTLFGKQAVVAVESMESIHCASQLLRPKPKAVLQCCGDSTPWHKNRDGPRFFSTVLALIFAMRCRGLADQPR